MTPAAVLSAVRTVERDRRKAVWLHHCSAESFIGFGQIVAEFQETLAGPPENVTPNG